MMLNLSVCPHTLTMRMIIVKVLKKFPQKLCRDMNIQSMDTNAQINVQRMVMIIGAHLKGIIKSLKPHAPHAFHLVSFLQKKALSSKVMIHNFNLSELPSHRSGFNSLHLHLIFHLSLLMSQLSPSMQILWRHLLV